MLNIIHKRSMLAVQLTVAAIWPTSVWATALALETSFSSVSTFGWLLVFLLTAFSSLAALLTKLKSEVPDKLALYTVSHMLSGVLAGFLCFFAISATNTPENGFAQALSIAAASWLGAKFIDHLAEKYLGSAGKGVSDANA